MVVSVFGKKVRLSRGEEKLKIEYIGEIGKRLILKLQFEDEPLKHHPWGVTLAN